jgi:hypothetical protein
MEPSEIASILEKIADSGMSIDKYLTNTRCHSAALNIFGIRPGLQLKVWKVLMIDVAGEITES